MKNYETVDLQKKMHVELRCNFGIFSLYRIILRTSNKYKTSMPCVKDAKSPTGRTPAT